MSDEAGKPSGEDGPPGAAAIPPTEPLDELPTEGPGGIGPPPRLRRCYSWRSEWQMHSCLSCDYSTSVRRDFDRHQQRSHRGRVYKCSVCGSQTTNYERARSHRWWNPRCRHAVDANAEPPMGITPQAAANRQEIRGNRGYPRNRSRRWMMSGPTEVEVVPAGAALPLDPGPSDEEDDIGHRREPE